MLNCSESFSHAGVCRTKRGPDGVLCRIALWTDDNILLLDARMLISSAERGYHSFPDLNMTTVLEDKSRWARPLGPRLRVTSGSFQPSHVRQRTHSDSYVAVLSIEGSLAKWEDETKLLSACILAYQLSKAVLLGAASRSLN